MTDKEEASKLQSKADKSNDPKLKEISEEIQSSVDKEESNKDEK